MCALQHYCVHVRICIWCFPLLLHHQDSVAIELKRYDRSSVVSTFHGKICGCHFLDRGVSHHVLLGITDLRKCI